MRSVTTRTVALVFVVGLLAACESSSAGSTPTTAASESSTTDAPTAAPASSMDEAAPFHAIPADAVSVDGTAACRFSEGAEGFTVDCELDMSDPRVSGSERHDRFRFFAEGPDGMVWVVERAVITNAEGTWRGSAQAAENDQAIPSGEAHYVGEGAYEGLEFHYYFFHADLDDKAELRGWISGGG